MKRYVSGTPSGALQSMRGKTARMLLEDRADSTAWYADNYTIVYELVPVSIKELLAAVKEAKGE